jgi:O-antigen ligase
MEGRSGLIVSLTAVAVKLYFCIEQQKERMIVTLAAIFALFILYLFFYDNIYTYFNQTFLLGDEYRGVNTRFVGRDELWESGWKCFIESPIIGYGVGFGECGVEAHNFFLYGLSRFGSLSLLIFGIANGCTA